MPDPEALPDGTDSSLMARRAPAPAANSIGRVITGPLVSHCRAVRVSEDRAFLHWLEKAHEALPMRSPGASREGAASPGSRLEPSAAEELARRVAAEDAPAGAADDEADAKPPEAREPSGDDRMKGIPEAIVLKRRGSASSGRDGGAANQREKRNMAGNVVRAKIPSKREAARGGTRTDGAAPPIESDRFLKFEDYNEGNTRVAPLKRGNALAPGERRLKRPKFLDGKLPRSVERGVLHPNPVRLFITSLLLLATKLLLIAVVIAFPIAAFIDGRTLIPRLLPLFLTFLVVGGLFIYCSNKTRCRVCSCHFYYVRRCHKHRTAHRLPLVGMACTAALHLLFFKWMRCMYCGTAIRLRGSTGVGKPVGEKVDQPVIERDEED